MWTLPQSMKAEFIFLNKYEVGCRNICSRMNVCMYVRKYLHIFISIKLYTSMYCMFIAKKGVAKSNSNKLTNQVCWYRMEFDLLLLINSHSSWLPTVDAVIGVRKVQKSERVASSMVQVHTAWRPTKRHMMAQFELFLRITPKWAAKTVAAGATEGGWADSELAFEPLCM